MAKFRQSKVKRKHHVLRDLEDGLHLIASWESVDGIIPGTISPKSGGFMGFTFQYFTQSGLKLIGRSSGAAQEVFIITREPEQVLAKLRDQKLLRSHPPEVVPPPPGQN